MRMRQAWIILTGYVCIRLFLYVDFEFDAVQRGVIGQGHIIFAGMFFVFFLFLSIVLFVWLIIKRAFAPALIYAFIACSLIAQIAFGSQVASFDMAIKGRIYAAYPKLCPFTSLQSKTLYICYEYDVPITGGAHERLVFDADDTMSLPPREWPERLKKIFLGGGVVSGNDELLCEFKNTKLIAGHIYSVSSDCWRH